MTSERDCLLFGAMFPRNGALLLFAAEKEKLKEMATCQTPKFHLSLQLIRPLHIDRHKTLGATFRMFISLECDRLFAKGRFF